MQINTKFDVGESVVFLHDDTLASRIISKVIIEVMIDRDPCITYYFQNPPVNRYHSPVYKYENELARTKEELVQLIPVSNG